MLRDAALTSKKLALVNAEAERLYWRLLMVADDFGRFDADPVVVRSKCFPRHGDAVSIQCVKSAWTDLVLHGLMVSYTVNGDSLGQFAKWDQRVRAEKSKFAAPERGQMRADVRKSPSSAAVVVDVDVDEGGGGDVARANGAHAPAPPAFVPVSQGPEAKHHASEDSPGCADCAALLKVLADVPVIFGSLGEAGYAQVHEAHVLAGQQRAVAAVRGQVERFRRREVERRFLAPEVLFKRKNWQVTVNSVEERRPAMTVEDILAAAKGPKS